jgi:hypothetical protein
MAVVAEYNMEVVVVAALDSMMEEVVALGSTVEEDVELARIHMCPMSKRPNFLKMVLLARIVEADRAVNHQ